MDMRRIVILFALVFSITAVAQENETMIVRLAEIEVYPQHLKEYLEFANEVDRLSVEQEPGENLVTQTCVCRASAWP